MKILTTLAIAGTLILTGCGEAITPQKNEAPVLGFGDVVLQCGIPGDPADPCMLHCEIYFDDPERIIDPFVVEHGENAELVLVGEGMHSVTAVVFEHCGNDRGDPSEWMHDHYAEDATAYVEATHGIRLDVSTRDSTETDHFRVDAGGVHNKIYHYIDPDVPALN